MRKQLYFFGLFIAPLFIQAQNVAINNDGSQPHPNAQLDIKAINKGILIPRGDNLTRTALNSNTAKGLLMNDTTTNTIWIHNGNGSASGWQILSSGINYWEQNGALGTEIKNTNTGGFWSANSSTVLFDPGAILPPTSGAGTRMMWLPQKSAFRIGSVDGNDWNADSIGVWSMAMGFNAKATGAAAFSMGTNTDSRGYTSFALGYGTKATGSISTAIGENTIASGITSTAMGRNTSAIGNYSTAMGYYTDAGGHYSTSLGYITSSKAFSSLAIGRFNDSTASSKTSWVDTDPLFYIGNGSSNFARHNALTIYKNGNMVLKNPTTVISTPVSFVIPVSGGGTRMMWLPEKSAFRAGTVSNLNWDADSIGTWSFATGFSSKAKADYAVAMGEFAEANGENSFSAGSLTKANGTSSIALGSSTIANGSSSFSAGLSTRATGDNSFSSGTQTVARAYSSFALGIFNDSIAGSSLNSINADNPLFYIGNGTGESVRHNAMVVYFNGNTILKNPTIVTVDPPSFSLPINGAGTRMMWMPEKGAFRFGTVYTTQWDAANIGLHSFAGGLNNIATGNKSVSFGERDTASGQGSFAMGFASKASGNSSTAFGAFTKATGDYSFAAGNGSKAEGDFSVAFGVGAVSTGSASASIGNATISAGNSSMAMGNGTIARGDNSVSAGMGTVSRSNGSLSIGRYNDSLTSSPAGSWITTDPLLILGNGTSDAARSNAMVVYKNGNTNISGFTQLGKSSDGAPLIKTKKLTGFNTPSSAAPNSYTFVPHGIANSNKILSISVIVTDGSYQFIPHSPDAGFLFTVNTDPTGGGAGPSIAVGVKSIALSSAVMNKPIKIFITYEE